MSLLRDDKDFQSCDRATQTLCGPYTADIQSLYSKYRGCLHWRIPDLGGKSWKWIRNRSIWLRSGSYSYRMDPTSSGKPLGCLPGLKTPLENPKIQVFRVFPYFPVFSYHPSTATGLPLRAAPQQGPQGGRGAGGQKRIAHLGGQE